MAGLAPGGRFSTAVRAVSLKGFTCHYALRNDGSILLSTSFKKKKSKLGMRKFNAMIFQRLISLGLCHFCADGDGCRQMES